MSLLSVTGHRDISRIHDNLSRGYDIERLLGVVSVVSVRNFEKSWPVGQTIFRNVVAMRSTEDAGIGATSAEKWHTTLVS